MLWRDVFDRLDRFPRDGMIDAFELQQAFEQLESLKLDMAKIRRLMLKYDDDGDGTRSLLTRTPTPTPTPTSIPRRQPRPLASSAPRVLVITSSIPSPPAAISPRGNGDRHGRAFRKMFATGPPVPSAALRMGLHLSTKPSSDRSRHVTGALATTVSQISRLY